MYIGRGRFVQQTADGGYIFTGHDSWYDQGNVTLVKTFENGTVQWTQTFKGGSSYDVLQTQDGGYIIGGESQYYGPGYSDFWVIRTDENGTELWNKTYGGESEERLYSIRQTPDNGFVIAGDTYSFGTRDNWDMWLVKTDSNGVDLWNYTYSKYYGAEVRSMQQTKDGGYILAGWTHPTESGGNHWEIYLVKTDANGIKLWDRVIPNSDRAHCVNQTLDGGYITAGVSSNSWHVVKTDVTGQTTWAKYLGFAYGTLYSIHQTSDGGYILAGNLKETVPPKFNRDIVLMKLEKPQPVSANANGHYYGLVGTPVGFIGDASGGEPPYNWDWDFGDGQQSSNKNPQHGYTNPGNYSVQLIVSDTTGLPDSSDIDVTYAWVQESNNDPNPPLITGEQRGTAGEVYDYTFQSTDPDDSPIYYLIEWENNASTSWLGMYPSGHELTLSYSWDEKGTYNIRAKTKDVYGAESDWSVLTVRMPHSNIINAQRFSMIDRLSERFPLLHHILVQIF